MEKLIWQIYERVYDLILLRLIPYRRMIEKAYEILAPRQGGLYLDAGCGTGNFLSFLADYQEDVHAVGVDFSPAMLNRARRKLRGREQRIKLQELDLNTVMPFPRNNFDGIVCINVLYAVKVPGFVLEELSRVLNSAGRLVVITPLKDPRMSSVLKEHTEALKDNYPRLWPVVFAGLFLKLLFPAVVLILINQLIKYNKNYTFFREQEIKDLFNESGLQIQDVELIYGEQNWVVTACKKPGNLSIPGPVFKKAGGNVYE